MENLLFKFYLLILVPLAGKQAGLTNLSNWIPLPSLVLMTSRAISFLPSPPGLLRGRNWSCFTISLTWDWNYWSHHHKLSSNLEGLLTRISGNDIVVPHPDKPVLVPVLGVEAMGSRYQHPGSEDGGCTHEVSLTTGLSQEQAGQPGKAAFRSCLSTLTVRICPDNSTSSAFLVWSITALSFSTLTWKLF